MKTVRLFLLPTSLARLIERERGGQRFVEGYFPIQDGRGVHVQLEGSAGRLALVSRGAGEPTENWADLPQAQAEALLDVTPGRVGYVRTGVSYGSRTILLSRFFDPGPLDLVTIEFDTKEEAQDFRPLPWLGSDVTADAGYQNRTLALDGLPAVPEVPLTNEALESLLDGLESRTVAQLQPQDSAAAEAVGPQQPAGSWAEPEALTDAEEVEEDSEIQDGVIKGLARSLRLHRRSKTHE
jgi:CYTH domain-containing protein